MWPAFYLVHPSADACEFWCGGVSLGEFMAAAAPDRPWLVLRNVHGCPVGVRHGPLTVVPPPHQFPGAEGCLGGTGDLQCCDVASMSVLPRAADGAGGRFWAAPDLWKGMVAELPDWFGSRYLLTTHDDGLQCRFTTRRMKDGREVLARLILRRLDLLLGGSGKGWRKDLDDGPLWSLAQRGVAIYFADASERGEAVVCEVGREAGDVSDAAQMCETGKARRVGAIGVTEEGVVFRPGGGSSAMPK